MKYNIRVHYCEILYIMLIAFNKGTPHPEMLWLIAVNGVKIAEAVLVLILFYIILTAVVT